MLDHSSHFETTLENLVFFPVRVGIFPKSAPFIPSLLNLANIRSNNVYRPDDGLHVRLLLKRWKNVLGEKTASKTNHWKLSARTDQSSIGDSAKDGGSRLLSELC